MSASRFPVVGCYVRKESGLRLSAIVWIARPCVAYVAKLIYEVFESAHVHSYYPFCIIKFDYLHKGEF